MNHLLKKTILATQLVLLALISFSSAQAAGELDTSFNGGAFQQPIRHVLVIKRQPDGKILIGGDFEAANGALRYSIARLNADSTIDTTFNPPDTLQGTIRSIAIQPDGKILIGGNFLIPLLTNWTVIARLNADGSFDSTFATPTTSQASPLNPNSVNDIAVGSDGKIFIAGSFSYTPPGGGTKTKFARLNSDGLTDATFNPAGLFTDINDIELQADGKLVGVTTDGGTGSRFIKRFNPDGTEDTTFNALVTGSVNALKLQPDGKILLGGNFTFVNNIERVDVARLNTNGTLDTAFFVTTNGVVNDIDVDADGKILLGGYFEFINGDFRRNLARVDANGNLDNTFAPVLSLPEIVYVILPVPDGKYLVSLGLPPSTTEHKVIRLNNDGTLEHGFAGLVGVRGVVTDIVAQPDGKILVAGDIGAINNFNRPGIARFNADGTPDTTFNPPLPRPDSNPGLLFIRAIALQPDGKILVGGQFFDGLGGLPATLYRLNPDGSLDNTFNAPASAGTSSLISDIIVQPDGKILSFPGNPNCGCTLSARRYNTNGSLDATFSATFNDSVNRAIRQADGKILVGGAFSMVNNTPRGRVARLNTDGTLDATFNPVSGANNTVYDMGLQADGKIVIGGSFLSYNGTTRNHLARLNSDGNLDGSFTTAADNSVRAIKIEPNGKIIIGGDFTLVDGFARNKITRLNPNGTLDLSFNTGTGIYGVVHSLELQPDNKIVVGGNFTKYNDIPRVSIVRLLNDAAARTQFDFDGDGKADLSVFRPSNGTWYIQQSQNGFTATQFGASGDVIAPADFDGDGKTDLAVYRAGTWYVQRSALGFTSFAFGASGDVPVPGDYDGDGKADVAVFRPSNGTWYRLNSQNNLFVAIQFGQNGDRPTMGDYDGDGKFDLSVFRPSNGVWYRTDSSNGQVVSSAFGTSGDLTVPADYDGDGKTDMAVFRPSNGTWYLQRSQLGFTGVAFGEATDKPTPADYDGDGKADVAVFRPSNGTWYLQRSQLGFAAVAFGTAEDNPAPNAFVR